MRLFPPAITAAIFAALLLPFGLSFLAPQLEPYPAIIMPSGASLVHLERKHIQFIHTTLWGQSGSGEWRAVDPRALLDPIPVWYLDGLVRHDFGLSTPPTEAVPLRWIRTIHVPRPQPSHESVLQTEAWLRERLRAAGADQPVLRVTQERVTVTVPEGRVVDDVLVSEHVYQLDQG